MCHQPATLTWTHCISALSSACVLLHRLLRVGEECSDGTSSRALLSQSKADGSLQALSGVTS